MKVSLNTIRQYIDFELPSVNDLVARINEQLGQVEEVIDLQDKYKDVVVVKVVACEKHPNADRLSVCMIDDGGVVSEVERDENGLVQVVCGAPNVRAGLFAAWLPPKSTVPASYGDVQPFVLDARDLRGVKSNGMLAAADELALGVDHAGIIEINPEEWKPGSEEIKPGASFAKVYGLDDTILDIENKMFTHRPDCFGQLGVAREISGILGHAFKSPSWYIDQPSFVAADGLELTVTNEAAEKVPRFMAVAIKNVEVKQSPLWLQIELVRLGGKPINNIVDVTNYVMLLTAQPTHAYDYDKLAGHMLGTRFAKQGEKAMLLNGKTYELSEDDIVIVDGNGIVGLGGVMGGGNSEVSQETKNIVLECATFDMYAVRKTSMRHGLFTDALTRFNKGQSALQQANVLALLKMSVTDVAGGVQASEVFDVVKSDQPHQNDTLQIDLSFVNDRLGLELSEDDMANLLQNVEFDVSKAPFTVRAPFWRTDIQLPEDVVEEIGRLYGFDKLPRVLPTRTIAPAPKNPLFELKRRVRTILSRAGANEVLTYSFVHENLMKKVGQDPAHAFRLSNALSPDLQYYRLSLTPSLLDKVHMNVKAGYGDFTLYEIGKSHFVGEMDAADPSVPNEDTHVAVVTVHAGKQQPAGAPYYQAKRYLDLLYAGTAYTLVPLIDFNIAGDERGRQLVAPYEPSRSAVLVKDEQVCGVVGEYRAVVRQALKLPASCAGFEINSDILANNLASTKTYKPLSRFPKVTQDISLKVASAISYAALKNVVDEEVGKHVSGTLSADLSLLGIYQSLDDPSHKTITFRLAVGSYEKTLTDTEVNAIMESLASAAKGQLAAERI